MSSFFRQIGPYWCFMAFGTHHLSLASLANYPSHQPPGQYPLFWAWGVLSVAPPEPILWPESLKTQENHVLAPNPRGPKMTIGNFSPQDFNHGLWQSPEAPSQLCKGFPSISGKPPTSTQNWTHHAGTKDGTYMVLYTLCTIFPQKFNGDVLRTPLHHSNSSPQIHHPF
ncbi:hypothetical protein O181_089385 [Austropuccinia psidii MF-1]|uniref:Uncharacterized protein n=1 Tax=Austropuccinia psidii MF-1 TaxID=1389203 RepID=A0A9Q3ITQ1_9BASI|nr:hypothetical protein [Austropuccinia psidii MF-1]